MFHERGGIKIKITEKSSWVITKYLETKQHSCKRLMGGGRVSRQTESILN